MDRRSCSVRWPAIIAALALTLVPAAGCKSALESFALLWGGYDIPPDCDGLKEGTVAIVCKMVTLEQFSNSGAARQLSEAIYERLKAGNKKIKVIDPQKVAKLLDEQGLDDPVEIGRNLKADKVIAIDIESFSVVDGMTLFRGRSTLRVRLVNVQTKEVEWHKEPPQFEWPAMAPTPAQDTTEAAFRNQFVDELAEQIGRYFYPHDRYAKPNDNNN